MYVINFPEHPMATQFLCDQIAQSSLISFLLTWEIVTKQKYIENTFKSLVSKFESIFDNKWISLTDLEPEMLNIIALRIFMLEIERDAETHAIKEKLKQRLGGICFRNFLDLKDVKDIVLEHGGGELQQLLYRRPLEGLSITQNTYQTILSLFELLQRKWTCFGNDFKISAIQIENDIQLIKDLEVSIIDDSKKTDLVNDLKKIYQMLPELHIPKDIQEYVDNLIKPTEKNNKSKCNKYRYVCKLS